MSPLTPPKPVRTRVLDLDLAGTGEGGYLPLRLELLADSTLVRIRARVRPVATWFDLLLHLFHTLRDHPTGRLPLQAMRYTLIDVRSSELIVPARRADTTLTKHVVGVHDSEFRTALDRRRRMRLVVDMLHQLPWPDDADDAAAHDARDESAGPMLDDEAASSIGSAMAPDDDELDIIIDDPLRPDDPDSQQPQPVGTPTTGAWSKWHRAYAVARPSSSEARR